MAKSRHSREESVASQHVDHFVSLERRRDQEHDWTPSVRVKTEHTGHTSRSHSRAGSHGSHEQETQNLKLVIDHLRKKLRCRVHDRGNQIPPSSSRFEDSIYRSRSKTPPSESFSTSSRLDRVGRHSKRHKDSSFPKSMGNDAMSKALCQIAKSPFTWRIDRAKLPHRLTQPIFIIYNGRTDLVEHVSQFNQRMAIHSRNEASTG